MRSLREERKQCVGKVELSEYLQNFSYPGAFEDGVRWADENPMWHNTQDGDYPELYIELTGDFNTKPVLVYDENGEYKVACRYFTENGWKWDEEIIGNNIKWIHINEQKSSI